MDPVVSTKTPPKTVPPETIHTRIQATLAHHSTIGAYLTAVNRYYRDYVMYKDRSPRISEAASLMSVVKLYESEVLIRRLITDVSDLLQRMKLELGDPLP